MIRAEHVEIVTDEGRYVLVVWDEASTDKLSIDIHDSVLDFYAQVQREIRPYVLEADLEAEHARATMPQPVTNRPVSVEDAVDAGYALDDPKSPGFHDRMVGDN